MIDIYSSFFSVSVSCSVFGFLMTSHRKASLMSSLDLSGGRCWISEYDADDDDDDEYFVAVAVAEDEFVGNRRSCMATDDVVSSVIGCCCCCCCCCCCMDVCWADAAVEVITGWEDVALVAAVKTVELLAVTTGWLFELIKLIVASKLFCSLGDELTLFNWAANGCFCPVLRFSTGAIWAELVVVVDGAKAAVLFDDCNKAVAKMSGGIGTLSGVATDDGTVLCGVWNCGSGAGVSLDMVLVEFIVVARLNRWKTELGEPF